MILHVLWYIHISLYKFSYLKYLLNKATFAIIGYYIINWHDYIKTYKFLHLSLS